MNSRVKKLEMRKTNGIGTFKTVMLRIFKINTWNAWGIVSLSEITMFLRLMAIVALLYFQFFLNINAELIVNNCYVKTLNRVIKANVSLKVNKHRPNIASIFFILSVHQKYLYYTSTNAEKLIFYRNNFLSCVLTFWSTH